MEMMKTIELVSQRVGLLRLESKSLRRGMKEERSEVCEEGVEDPCGRGR